MLSTNEIRNCSAGATDGAGRLDEFRFARLVEEKLKDKFRALLGDCRDKIRETSDPSVHTHHLLERIDNAMNERAPEAATDKPECPAPDFSNITAPRMVEYMNMLVRYGDHSTIAEEMGVSPKTITTYMERCLDATGIGNKVLLAVWWDRYCRGV